MRYVVVLILAISALFLLVCMSGGEDSDAASPVTHPEDLYPDADVIITKDKQNRTVVTFKAYGKYKPTPSHPSEWFTEVLGSSNEVRVRGLSDVKDSINIVYDGATVNRLFLLDIDSKASMNSAVDLNFTMVSGSIGTLSMVSVLSTVRQYIGNSYDTMPIPIRNAQLNLEGGDIDLLNPTFLMVSVGHLDLTMGKGMTINRVFTTGENGRYSSVDVCVNGATIGYMSNIASKIGTINYSFESGSVDYLCFGANTENVSSRVLSNMATSYISGDVKAFVSEEVQIKKCILGGGIFEIPIRLCNGENVREPVVHSVVIEAPGKTVSNDIMFMTDSRNRAYHFNYYKIGHTPYAQTTMDVFILGDRTYDVYSENGIWSSSVVSTIPTGSLLSVNTGYVIPSGSTFNISKGATLVNSDQLIVSGTVEIEGNVVNNGIIQCRKDCVINGTPGGIGVCADYRTYSEYSPELNVLSDRSAVIIEQIPDNEVESVTATFLVSETDMYKPSVSITAPEDEPFTGSMFMLSLKEGPGGSDFTASYELDVWGIDIRVLERSDISVTIPVSNSSCTAVYAFDKDDNRYVMVGTSEFEPNLTFKAGVYDKFYTSTYISDRPAPPNPQGDTEVGGLDYILIAAIIAVLAATMYLLVTMKRD